MELESKVMADSSANFGSAEAEKVEASLEIPSDLLDTLVADYDPDYCVNWRKMEKERKRRMTTKDWSKARIVTIGSRESDKENIFMSMECSFCLKICPPGSKACGGGHLICPECVEIVGSCPFESVNKFETKNYCKLAILDAPLPVPVHDLLSDAVDASLRCKFSEFGCPKKLRQRRLWVHEMKCAFHPKFACSFDDCNASQLTGPGLIDHLVQVHQVPLMDANYLGAVFPFKKIPSNSQQGYSWTLGIFLSHDVHFLLSMAIDGDKVYFFCSNLEEEFQDKFFMKITLKDNQNMIIANYWEFESVPFYVSHLKIIKENSYVRARAEENLLRFMDFYVWKTAAEENQDNGNGTGTGKDGLEFDCPSFKMDVMIQTGLEKELAYINAPYGLKNH